MATIWKAGSHTQSTSPQTGVLRQRPAGLVVAGNWLTLPRRRGHLAFPSTGRQQQNAAPQQLPMRTRTHRHTLHQLFIYIQTQIHPIVWVGQHAPKIMLEQKYKCMCVQLGIYRQSRAHGLSNRRFAMKTESTNKPRVNLSTGRKK